MHQRFTLPVLPCFEQLLPSIVRQPHFAGFPDIEIVGAHYAIVNHRQHKPINEYRPQLLHAVKRKGIPSRPIYMHEPNRRIQANPKQGRSAVARQSRIEQRQHRIHPITRWAARTTREMKIILISKYHLIKHRIVNLRGIALDSTQRIERITFPNHFHGIEQARRRRPHGVNVHAKTVIANRALQNPTRVVYLAQNAIPSHGKRKRLVFRSPELRFLQQHISRACTPRIRKVPSAGREERKPDAPLAASAHQSRACAGVREQADSLKRMQRKSPQGIVADFRNDIFTIKRQVSIFGKHVQRVLDLLHFQASNAASM